MDNQHPSSVKEKDQRPSRKRVLDDYIVWETPRIETIYYVYRLEDDEGGLYFGCTVNPAKRVWQHLKDKTVNPDSMKMYVIHKYTDREEAAMKENELMGSLETLNKVVSGYTRTHSFYDCVDLKILVFDSTQEASEALNLKGTSDYTERLKHRYVKLFPKETVEQAVLRHHRYKGKPYKGEVEYFINQQHAATVIGCSVSMVNMCVMGLRQSVKGWQVVDKEGEFKDMGFSGGGKKIICIETGELFYSHAEAGEVMKIASSTIAKVVKGTRKTAGGFTFKLQ